MVNAADGVRVVRVPDIVPDPSRTKPLMVLEEVGAVIAPVLRVPVMAVLFPRVIAEPVSVIVESPIDVAPVNLASLLDVPPDVETFPPEAQFPELRQTVPL